ncbi:MAG: 2-dehydropantoate 2-reductase N-terminal domain-containing protein [Candidatus Sulfotelmatobacter sp.]
MYVVLGASGNTGHVVARNLLAAGKKVRVVGRSATHLQPLAASGAEISSATSPTWPPLPKRSNKQTQPM